MSADAPLRVAALGAWHVHVDDYAAHVTAHPRAELAYVWDPDPVRGAEVARRWGVPHIDGDGLDDVLDAHPVDAVAVTVAPADKTRTILAALASGAHVVTEKPLALDEATARELQRVAVASGRHLWLSLPFQHSPGVEAAILAMKTGTLGRITEVRVRMGIDGGTVGWLPARFLDPREALGGVLADLVCHALAIVDRLLHAEPVVTTCVSGALPGSGVEDRAIVVQRYPEDVIAVVESSFVDRPGGTFLVEVTGTTGALHWDADAGARLMTGGSSVAVPMDEWPPHPATQFLDAVAEGRPVGDTFAEAITLSRTLERVRASIAR